MAGMERGTGQLTIEDFNKLLDVADDLADKLRSANAVIERMSAAQFNSAILDRIQESLVRYQDVCRNIK